MRLALRELISPVGHKSYWHECAAIIARLPEKVFVEQLDGAMAWFQDIN